MSAPERTHFQENFTGLELSDEVIKSVTYDECTFDSCNCIGTGFINCDFISCTFTDCTLSAVSPVGCRFDGVTFTDCKTIGIDWTKTRQFREVVFVNCQLNYSSFKLMKIPRIKMTGCEVKDADFSEAVLTKGDFRNTDFEMSRFMKTDLSGADFKDARNYAIDPRSNTLKKTRFSYPEVVSLLNSLDIIIE